MKRLILTLAPACASILLIPSSVLAGEAGIINPMAVPETVVITASPFAQNPLDVAASVSQVTRQELITSGGFGIGDVLQNLPGVATTGFSTGANRPVIRGLSSTRVKVTENGIGGHDTSDVGDDHAVPIDALATLQVEVLRGPATLRYGSQAIGGVVNAVNNRVPIDVGEGTAVEGFAGISSNSVERLGGALADYRTGHFALHADGLIRGADDYDNPKDTQINSYVFGHGYALGGAYIGDGGSAAGLGFNEYVAHYGAPFDPASGSKSHTYLDTKSYNSAARWNEPVPGIMRLNFQGGYTDYFHNEAEDASGLRAHFMNKEWEGRLEALHNPFGPIANGAIGIQYDNRDFAVSGPESDYLHPTKTQSIGTYIFEEFKITDQFSIQGAARIEWTSIKGDTDALGSFDRRFTPLSFAVGAVYKPLTDTSLFINVSRTERAPSPVELFAQGPHDTSKTFEFGDPSLTKETAFSVEGGIKHQDMMGNTATFSAYHTNFKGFIDGFLTGNSRDGDGTFHPDLSGEFRELFYLQKDATFWGLEAETHWHLFSIPAGRIGIDAQADYVRATLKNAGNVPRIPPLRYGGGVFFENSKLELKVGFLHTDRQDKLGPQETVTAGYTFLNASAIMHLFSGPSGDWDVALIGTNLTNQEARNHISFSKDLILLPGTTVRAVLHYMH